MVRKKNILFSAVSLSCVSFSSSRIKYLVKENKVCYKDIEENGYKIKDVDIETFRIISYFGESCQYRDYEKDKIMFIIKI